MQDILQAEVIRKLIGEGAVMGSEILCAKSLPSTNNVAMQMAMEGAPEGLLVIADSQSAGKGSRGRSWVSPAGSSISMSLVLRPKVRPDKASMITLAAGLAVRDVLGQYADNCLIKWPNDVVIGGRKLVGILTEMRCGKAGIEQVILGIGINVHTESFPEDIKETATSLYLETGRHVDRSEIIAGICRAVEKRMAQFEAAADLSLMMDAYNQKLVNVGREVMLVGAEESERGICLGISSDGSLNVRLSDGSIKNIIAGEVSVRGIYGYA